MCGLYQLLTASPGSCPSTASDAMGSWGWQDRTTYQILLEAHSEDSYLLSTLEPQSLKKNPHVTTRD